MYSFLLLGFLVGMGHSLEADHLAAVGAMANTMLAVMQEDGLRTDKAPTPL